MLTKDFYFDLPPELIAQKPASERGNDRLMLLNRKDGSISHRIIADLPNLLPIGTLLVFNNSRVRRSRMFAQALDVRTECVAAPMAKETEFLFLNAIDDSDMVWKVMVKNARRQKVGKRFLFAGGLSAVIQNNPADIGTEFRTLSFDTPLSESWFEQNGHIPLPPYIKREDTEADSERYQTIYATETGSAAAPTAGLHFTDELLESLQRKGFDLAWLTLHVGLGTFLPVRAEQIEDHVMHEEFFHIGKDTARKIERARAEDRPILAVGTTTVRTLESAWDEKLQTLRTGSQSTRIFMYPGYQFKVCNMLFTNFHTPESTLLMLVSALVGKDKLFAAYEEAVKQKYHFFSYGDAMLIQ